MLVNFENLKFFEEKIDKNSKVTVRLRYATKFPF